MSKIDYPPIEEKIGSPAEKTAEKESLYGSVPDSAKIADGVLKSKDFDSTLEINRKQEKQQEEEIKKAGLKTKILRMLNKEAWKSATLEELEKHAEPALARSSRVRRTELQRLKDENKIDQAKAYLFALGVKNMELPNEYNEEKKEYMKDLDKGGSIGQ